MHWLISLVITAAILLVISQLIRGFEVDGFGSALISALVIGIVNATLGVLLKVITFPLTFLTLGLFLLVINAAMLKVAAALVPGFRIRGCWPAILGAIVLAVANAMLRYVY